MIELNFAVDDVQARLHAAAPAITFKLRITASDPGQRIHNVLLQCQIQIESTRRRYNDEEQRRLVDLFGEHERWSQTLRSMLWTHVEVMVPPFEGETVVECHVPCTFDFNVAATKYFYGVEEGDVPLAFLFSGSIFHASDSGQLRVARIAWEKEAKFRLPVQVWQQMMDHYYPRSAWLCLQREVFDRLYQYKLREGIPTWERVLETLLPASSPSSSGNPQALSPDDFSTAPVSP